MYYAYLSGKDSFFIHFVAFVDNQLVPEPKTSDLDLKTGKLGVYSGPD